MRCRYLQGLIEISLHLLLLGCNQEITYPILSFLSLFTRSKCFTKAALFQVKAILVLLTFEETPTYLNFVNHFLTKSSYCHESVKVGPFLAPKGRDKKKAALILQNLQSRREDVVNREVGQRDLVMWFG